MVFSLIHAFLNDIIDVQKPSFSLLKIGFFSSQERRAEKDPGHFHSKTNRKTYIFENEEAKS